MASFSQPSFISSLLPINNNNNNINKKNLAAFKTSRISSSQNSQENPSAEELSKPQEKQDPVKLAFAKAKAYKNSPKSTTPTPDSVLQSPVQEIKDDFAISDEIKDRDVKKEVPLALKLAMEKANKYRQNKTLEESKGSVSKIVQNSSKESAEIDGMNDGFKGGNEITKQSKKSSSSKKDQLSVSNIDFMGLGFSDKKSGRSLPAGLVPFSDPFPDGDFPEVEILVGNTSNFGDSLAEESKPIPFQESNNDDDDELYKPQVSTWGLFPRPNDISKAYGGGRTLRPGQALETAEEKAAKEARTKQLLAAYKKKYGLNIDPKVKSECEKALKDGDSLMDLGELKQALPFYEEVMEKLPFQSELHGLAALQWSICQDSRNRSEEARVMYEKLQSHPSPKVSKKARQFVFGFQAMEMMKIRSFKRTPLSTEYQNYFEAFLQNKTNYQIEEAEVDEGGLNQVLPFQNNLLK